jgi:hypothetical protein
MRRIFLRLGVALVTFSLGVSLSVTNWHDDLPKVKLEEPVPPSCFPGLSVGVDKPQATYFPLIIFSENSWGNQFRSDWYSKHLQAMNEAPLASLVQEDESYRFLWLRTFHDPIAIRVWRSGSKQFIVAKRLNGSGGYEPGTLDAIHTRALSNSEWIEFLMHLETSCFWQMKSMDDNLLEDGAQWIIEAYRQGRYHLVDRQCPEPGSFREAGLYLLRISGLLEGIPEGQIY